jgi:hypothetical protein
VLARKPRYGTYPGFTEFAPFECALNQSFRDRGALLPDTTHGNQMSIADTAVVSVRPAPRVIALRLSPDDERAVFEWVSLNTAALIACWEGQVDTIQLGQLLKPLSLGQRGMPSVP